MTKKHIITLSPDRPSLSRITRQRLREALADAAVNLVLVPISGIASGNEVIERGLASARNRVERRLSFDTTGGVSLEQGVAGLGLPHSERFAAGMKKALDELRVLRASIDQAVGGARSESECRVQFSGDPNHQRTYFHVDVPFLTALMTLTGPGTLYYEQGEERDERYDPDTDLIRYSVGSGEDVCVVPPGVLALLKGERDSLDPRKRTRVFRERDGNRDYNRGNGLLHSAPVLGGSQSRIYWQCVYRDERPEFLETHA